MRDRTLVAKADVDGNQIWCNTYGRFPDRNGDNGNYRRNDEYATCVLEWTDNKLLIGGHFDGNQENDEGLVFALTSDGDSLWMRRYGGSNIVKLFATPDGGFVAAGRDRPNFWMFKADSLGEVEWEFIYDNGGYDEILDATQSIEGGYLLVGSRGSQVYVVETDSIGEQEWWQLYESDSLSIHCYSASSASDGGFILTGIGQGRLSHGYSIRIDENGEVMWNATYGYGGAWFHSCVQTSDGGFVFGGEDSGIHLGQANQYYIVRTDENGEQLWEADYGEGGDVCKDVRLPPPTGQHFAEIKVVCESLSQRS